MKSQIENQQRRQNELENNIENQQRRQNELGSQMEDQRRKQNEFDTEFRQVRDNQELTRETIQQQRVQIWQNQRRENALRTHIEGELQATIQHQQERITILENLTSTIWQLRNENRYRLARNQSGGGSEGKFHSAERNLFFCKYSPNI